jgi:hypothetical protein
MDMEKLDVIGRYTVRVLEISALLFVFMIVVLALVIIL